MYKVTVLTPGKYNNVSLGARYCITKKAVKNLVSLFLETECEIEVEQFIYIGDGIFCWSNILIDEKLENWICDEIAKTFGYN